MATEDERPEAVVCVLGCRSQSAALARRAEAAVRTYQARGATLAIVCGGRSWAGLVEADELFRRLVAGGVPEANVVRERCSLNTRDNARFAAALLRRRGIERVVLVTCSWHLPRAERAFRAAGLEVEGEGVEPPSATFLQRLYRRERERLSSWNDTRRTMRIV